jgi:hypothetical protein
MSLRLQSHAGGGAARHLGPRDAFVIPPREPFALCDASPDLRWIEVMIPALVPTISHP